MIGCNLRMEPYAQAKATFREFLDHDEFKYYAHIENMISEKKRRLIINMSHLRKFNSELVERFRDHPDAYMVAFESALEDKVREEDTTFMKNLEAENLRLRIGVVGSFGSHHVTPRYLKSMLLHKLVCIDGIITKVSLVRPRVVRSVHYCPTTNAFMKKDYSQTLRGGADAEMQSLADIEGQQPRSFIYPTHDAEGNALETEFGLSTYVDTQKIVVQEMPERAPTGQLPRSVDVVLDDDLVDSVKPGDRVQVIGRYELTNPRFAKSGYAGTFRTMIVANNVRQIGSDSLKNIFTEEDITQIKEFHREYKGKVFELLCNSIAPSIYGHSTIKRALLLLLLGGNEVLLENGTHLRGDINCLMIGDPSTAKSQLLRFLLNIAPLAINTTGRGSSGVGLTAAVTYDSESKERNLEAGAMVLADRGIVCIDEFDKMSDMDRVAIHEVMEQQTVTIAKAGIHATLNARCSVVAAANPVFGKYNRDRKASENINLPDSLLSRFDLLFIVLDEIDAARDLGIAEHVLRIHSYRKPGDSEYGMNMKELSDYINDEYEEEVEEITVFEKTDNYAHLKSEKNSRLSIPFLRNYIHYAKIFRPKLSEEALNDLVTSYATLRERSTLATDPMPVTPRTFETLIRLATAHAKARLSKVITEDDARMASEIVLSMFEDERIMERIEERRKRRKKVSGGKAKRRKVRGGGMAAKEEDEEATDLSSESGEDDIYKFTGEEEAIVRTQEISMESEDEEMEVSDEEESKDQSDEKEEEGGDLTHKEQIPPEHVIYFRERLNVLFRRQNTNEMRLDELIEFVNQGRARGGEAPIRLSEDVIRQMLSEMEAEDVVMHLRSTPNPFGDHTTNIYATTHRKSSGPEELQPRRT